MARSISDIMCTTRGPDVVRSKRGYVLTLSERKGHNDFQTTKLTADVVVICVPPHAWRNWTVARRCRSMLDAVQPASLYHVYAKGGRAPKKHTLEPAGQRIPSQYGNDWHQLMYSSGRVADFWYRMRLSRPEEFAALLGHKLQNIRGHHWQNAFHMWRPVHGFDLDTSVQNSVEPNPHELPGLYYANEAHSSHQAWMEGSLEMAMHVVSRLLYGVRPNYPAKLPANWVILDGWYLDVSKWKEVHPGSKKAIESHLKEDVRNLFEHIGHSNVAWATAHSLKHSPSN